MKKTLIVSSLIAVCCLLSKQTVSAQSLSLSISPPLMELTIQPGRSVTFSYQLTNNSENELSITPSVKKFIPIGSNGLIGFQALDKSNPLSLSFESGERFELPLILAVGQTKQLVVKLTVAPTALDKDYYQTLFFSTNSIDMTGVNQTGSMAQIGSNLLVTVSQSGDPAVSGKIDTLTIPRIIDSFSALPIAFSINNTGNTLFKPFGSVTVTGWFDQSKEVSILEQNVLANSTRSFTLASIKPEVPLGIFQVTAKFQPNGVPPFVEASTTIYYVPYKIIGGIIAVLFLIKLFRRKKANKLD